MEAPALFKHREEVTLVIRGAVDSEYDVCLGRPARGTAAVVMSRVQCELLARRMTDCAAATSALV